MKRTDLEKNRGLKINNKMNQAGKPARYGSESGLMLDRRAQRRRDQELGLVSFAVKLNGDLVKQVQTLAEARQVDMGEVVAELLRKGLTS